MRKDIDMLNGPLGPAIIRFTIPVILTTILQNLFNTVDLMVVGQFCGDLPFSAVTATTSLTNLLISLFTGLSLGAGITVARALGSRRDEDVSRAVHTAIPTALVGGALLTVVGTVFAPDLLEVMNTPAEVLPLSAVYIRVYFAGIVFTVVYNFGAAILRATGDTQRPLFYLLIAGALKVLLTLFVVVVCKMDVAGVALSTVISQGVAATLVTLALMRRADSCKLCLKKIRFYKAPLLNILKFGLPAGLQSSFNGIANLTTSVALNSFDSAALIAGNGASRELEMFTDAIGIGFTQAVPNFVAQNLGAKQYDRIKKSFLLCMGYATAFVLAACMLMFPFREPLLGLYIKDSAEALAYGMIRMQYILLPGFLMAAMTVSTGALQGLGHSLAASIIMLATNGALRMIWIYTVFFTMPEYHELKYLYLLYSVSWILTTAIAVPLFIILFQKKKRAALALNQQ